MTTASQNVLGALCLYAYRLKNTSNLLLNYYWYRYGVQLEKYTIYTPTHNIFNRYYFNLFFDIILPICCYSRLHIHTHTSQSFAIFNDLFICETYATSLCAFAAIAYTLKLPPDSAKNITRNWCLFSISVSGKFALCFEGKQSSQSKQEIDSFDMIFLSLFLISTLSSVTSLDEC